MRNVRVYPKRAQISDRVITLAPAFKPDGMNSSAQKENMKAFSYIDEDNNKALEKLGQYTIECNGQQYRNNFRKKSKAKSRTKNRTKSRKKRFK